MYDYDPMDQINHLEMQANANYRRERISKGGVSSLPTFTLIFLLPFIAVWYAGKFAWQRGISPLLSRTLRKHNNGKITKPEPDYKYRPGAK